jgi:outer membrane murein-binding lipoprotein Lpp
MLNGIDKGGAFLAKLFAKLCTYGVAYAVIYIAIQTALPGLRSAFIYNVAMIIVMAAPELMIAGLAVEAMEKLRENKALGLFLFIVAALFLSIGILTMVDVFFWKFADGSTGQQMLTLYRAIVVLLYSAVHGIVSKLNEQRHEKVQQVAQANDRLLLANHKKIDEVSALVETVHTAYTEQQKEIQLLREEIQALKDRIHHDVQNIDSGIDTRINQLASSVTEIHQNILQITQNNQYNLPEYTAQTHPYTPLARDERGAYSVHEVPENTAIPAITAGPVIPLLELPGVPQERIHDVLTLVLSGASWTAAGRQLSLNYSRHIMPIKEAYEHYQARLVSAS